MTIPAVTVRPSVAFGQPCVSGRPTEAVADAHWVGDDAADEYGLTRHELLVVLRFEATKGQPRFRRRWKAWGAMAGDRLWSSKTDPADVELPPTRDKPHVCPKTTTG